MQMLGAGDGPLLSSSPPPLADVKPGAPAGAINGGLYPYKADWPAQHPSVVIGVEDIAAAMARVVAAGGQVLGEPMDIPGVGAYVAFVDTEGNRHSMLKPLHGHEGATPCAS